MSTAENLMIALDAALGTARLEYRNAVLELAMDEDRKHVSSNREPANVNQIHHARTRVIARDAIALEFENGWVDDFGHNLGAT